MLLSQKQMLTSQNMRMPNPERFPKVNFGVWILLSLFSQRFVISKCLYYSRVLVPVPPSFILSNAFEQAEHYQLFSWVITEAFAALIVPWSLNLFIYRMYYLRLMFSLPYNRSLQGCLASLSCSSFVLCLWRRGSCMRCKNNAGIVCLKYRYAGRCVGSSKCWLRGCWLRKIRVDGKVWGRWSMTCETEIIRLLRGFQVRYHASHVLAFKAEEDCRFSSLRG